MDNLQFINFIKEEVVRHLRKNSLIKEIDNDMIDKIINVIIDNIKLGIKISHSDVHYFIKKIILNTCKYDIEKKYGTCTEINNVNKNILVNSLCKYFDEKTCDDIKKLINNNNNNNVQEFITLDNKSDINEKIESNNLLDSKKQNLITS